MSLSIDSALAKSVTPNANAITINAVLKTLIFFPPFYFFYESSNPDMSNQGANLKFRCSAAV
jgi:hypothetical protein